jgi:DNA helicase-4
VLSFTNKSSQDLKRKLVKLGEIFNTVEVLTFHKLGLAIIENVEKEKPKIAKLILGDFVAEKIKELLSEDYYIRLFNDYFIKYKYEFKNHFEFTNGEEHTRYMQDKKTIKGETLKSMEEIQIANHLHLNGINYIYEKQYKKIKTKYEPDFYLADYDVYIEHFGVKRNGDVPPFFKGKDGKTAKQVYNEGIAWKRDLHRQMNTKLVETFSYEKFEGVLFENLDEKLKSLGVIFKPKTEKDLLDETILKNKNEYKTFIKLITGFIAYIRSNQIEVSHLENKVIQLTSPYKKDRTKVFLGIVKPIIGGYIERLRAENEIDFDDMINKAKAYIKQQKFESDYRYILIDEYQDISSNRLDLVKSLKGQTNAKLFCVGDDWQSIYKFTGSNLSLFTNFSKHVGHVKIKKIETTYRSNQHVAAVSSQFIMMNTDQITKDVKSVKQSAKGVREAVKLVYITNKEERMKLEEILFGLPDRAYVMLLGRYSFDLDRYLGSRLEKQGDNSLKLQGREDLNIEFMTVHTSKGLEADYTVILNTKGGKLGFPSEIEDDSVFDIVKDTDEEEYPYAEERRLFYVALTRTKNDVWLMVETSNKSIFIKELEKDFEIT